MSEQQRKEFGDERREYLNAKWWILLMFVVVAPIPWIIAALSPHWSTVGNALIVVGLFGLLIYAALQRPN